MNIQQTIEDYQDLREACYRAARADNGALMGKDSWLRDAMCEDEIELNYGGGDHINCSGNTFTTQTQSNEWFDFSIPLSALNL